MNALFITILNMSIQASVVVFAILLVRIPLKKAPKIFSYAVWGVVLFRLIFPFSFESIFSLMPTSSNTIPNDIIFSQSPFIETGVQFLDVPVNTAINNTMPLTYAENNINPIQTFFNIAGYVWLFGLIALLLYAVIGYVSLKRRMYFSTLIYENIYETDKIKTPFVLGFICPKIYIPVGIELLQQDYILKHEQTHIKRFDYLIKPFAFIVVAVHWFNPFVWVAYFLMSKDMEMSCDEAVLRKANADIRSVYSSALLSLSVRRNSLLNPLAFGESDVKSRVRNVLNFKKPAVWLNIASLLVVIVVIVGCASNRATENSNGPEPVETSGEVYEVPDRAAENSEYPESIEVAGEIYENAELGIGIVFPPEYIGKYTVVDSQDRSAFSVTHTATNIILNERHYQVWGSEAEYGQDLGRLFVVYKMPLSEPENLSNHLINDTLLFQDDEYAYLLGKPTDVQFDWENGEGVEEYLELSELIEMIINSSYRINSGALNRTAESLPPITHNSIDAGIYIELPASWEDRYGVTEWDGFIRFFHIESIPEENPLNFHSGILFQIIRYEKETPEDVWEGPGLIVAETDYHFFNMDMPQDTAYIDIYQAEYDMMLEDLDLIRQSIAAIDITAGNPVSLP